VLAYQTGSLALKWGRKDHVMRTPLYLLQQFCLAYYPFPLQQIDQRLLLNDIAHQKLLKADHLFSIKFFGCDPIIY